MKLNIDLFTTSQKGFLNEYKTVMKPIANALDNLQQSKCCPYAIVLPTLYKTREELISLKNQNKLHFCKPLVCAVLNGFDKRLGYLFDITNEKSHAAIIATVTHPFFKIRWLKPAKRSTEYVSQVTNILVRAADKLAHDKWLDAQAKIQSESDQHQPNSNSNIGINVTDTERSAVASPSLILNSINEVAGKQNKLFGVFLFFILDLG